MQNPQLDLAWNFVEKTDRNIFLTGKAGTGKTTFLHRLKTESLKRLVVVAPTGVAAINAKGVTVHSFFQMPFGPILPDAQYSRDKNSFQRKFNKQKIDIIRSLDLLIIDEISMVRSDLLDGIDQVLRKYKNRNKVFGGAQVLMIGDLQQLSPVVKPQEWDMLKSYYETPYFFSSKSFLGCNPINIELKHIYRQDNQEFIGILNEIRNNKLSEKSAELLNQRFQPDFSPSIEEGYITLSTHNYRADNINNLELNKLKNKSKFYSAKLEGKFSEHSYPTDERLELKIGSQVMFIKNDSSPEKRYFNGKIGRIVDLDGSKVTVSCIGDEEDIITTSELWENVNYSINKETKKITENVIGSFSQIPLRLAWAITIHKSQGLTFEKAIIDAESSFAHGQTYVALSRCKTLEGIVLKTKITSSSIINDNRVSAFNKNMEENEPDISILGESQKSYYLNLVNDLFNYYDFMYPASRLIDIYYKNKTSVEGNMLDPITTIKERGIENILGISSGFKNQLLELSKTISDPENSEVIQERIKKGIAYFLNHTIENIKKPLDEFTFSTDNKAVKKDIDNFLGQLEDHLNFKLFCLKGLKEEFSIEKYLEIRAKAVLQKTQSTTTKKVKKEYTATTEHQVLFEQLRELRGVFAQEDGVAHYQVFTQKSLYEMCATFPVTAQELQDVNGMGKVRVEKYGEKIIEVIEDYCAENEINPSDFAPEMIEKKKEKREKGSSKIISFDLFKEGKTVEEISEKRGLVAGTILSHLSSFISTGEIKVEELIDKIKLLEMKKIIEETKFSNLSDLIQKTNYKYSYSEMRMVLSSLELKK